MGLAAAGLTDQGKPPVRPAFSPREPGAGLGVGGGGDEIIGAIFGAADKGQRELAHGRYRPPRGDTGGGSR